ncbi:hypothetical protein D3C81_2095930 [compost metagenome]
MVAMGRKIRLALATPYNVAVKASAIDGPSIVGSVRLPSTWMSPITVPMIPMVGA